MYYKTCSKCKTAKDSSDFNKQAKTKDGLHNYCRECNKACFKAWKPSPKPIVGEGKKHCKTCREVRDIDYFPINKDGASGIYSVCKVCCAQRGKAQRDCPIFSKANKVRSAEYTRNNRDKANAKSALRRANRNRATMGFDEKEFEDFFLKEIYHLALLRESVTGVKWQVDHTVPLLSEMVCGLHWHGNLKLITAYENLSKSNKYWPDMW